MKFHVPEAVLRAPQALKGGFASSRENLRAMIHGDRIRALKDEAEKLFLKYSYPMRRVYWFFAAPVVFSVEGIVRSQGKVLLLRRTYGRDEWAIPQGTLKDRESPTEGFMRVVKSELGIAPREAYRLGVHYSEEEHKRETIHYFFSDIDAPEILPDHVRIAEAKWFGMGSLPYPLSGTAEDALLRLSDFEAEHSLFLSRTDPKLEGQGGEHHEREERETD